MAHPRRPLSTALGVVLSTPVHLLTLALMAFGVVLLWPGTTWFQKLLGVLCLLLAYALRPALGDRSRDGSELDPRQFPETDALVREVALAVGAARPARVEVVSSPQADLRLTGLSGSVVSIAAPLWPALTGAERIALIGHQVGHLARRDVLVRRYLCGAIQTLLRWEDAMTPYRPGLAMRPQDQILASSSGSTVMAQAAHNGLVADLVNIVLWPLRAAVAGYRRLLEILAAPSLRDEALHADAAATRAAGTDATVALLEVLLALPALETSVNRAVAGRSDIAAAIVERVAAFDAGQRRAARNSEELGAIDDHPSTLERLRLVESAHRAEPGVVVSTDRWAVIDAELTDVVAKQLKLLADDYRYAH